MRVLFALALLALTTPAFAAPTLDLPAFDRPVHERITDGFGVGLLATGGAFVGAFGGAVVSTLACIGGDGFDCLYPAIIGAGVGIVGGVLGGAYVFDAVSDGDGSLWGAAGGVGIGILGGYLTGDPLILLLSVPIGAGLGYALFDSAPAVPSVAFLPDGQGGTRLSLALSGSF